MDKQTISCCAFREEVASYIIEFLKIKEWSIDNKMFAFNLNDNKLSLVNIVETSLPIILSNNQGMFMELFSSIEKFEPNANIVIVFIRIFEGCSSTVSCFIRSSSDNKDKFMQMCEKTSGSFMWNGSQWKSINSKFTKKFDQIYLPDDKVSFIKKTLKTFIDHKQYFVENGIPYKLSFLFEGNPGTGKTSVIKAIANELKYYVFIINAEKISYISDLIHEMKKRTPDNGNVIIVFEDIHKLQPETYNQIYGFLDGIYDITNCVIIMTTNIPHKKLDPTLVRAGRVNHIIKFDYLTEELMLKMFNNILPNCSGLVDKFINKIKHIKITPAVLESYLVKYRFAENEENKYGATIFNIQELIDTANTEADAYSNFDDSSSDSFYI